MTHCTMSTNSILQSLAESPFCYPLGLAPKEGKAPPCKACLMPFAKSIKLVLRQLWKDLCSSWGKGSGTAASPISLPPKQIQFFNHSRNSPKDFILQNEKVKEYPFTHTRNSSQVHKAHHDVSMVSPSGMKKKRRWMYTDKRTQILHSGLSHHAFLVLSALITSGW